MPNKQNTTTTAAAATAAKPDPNVSNRTREVLRAYGFTKKSLAFALGTTESKAKRILTPGRKIYFSEFMQILSIIRSTDPNLIFYGADYYYLNK